MRPSPLAFRMIFCVGTVFAGGCAHPTVPEPPPASELTAADARREERLKVMQEYWDDHTGATNRNNPSREGITLLEYPAGIYAGINFAPRLAPDPALTEPNR